jgi:hypothetical protein
MHRVRLNAPVLVLLLISTLTIFAAQELRPRDIAKNAFPSVVLLTMQDSNGQPISLGSGFFVRENIVATNLHVIEGAAAGYAKLVAQETSYPVKGVVAIDEARDLALLAVDAPAPLLPLGGSDTLEVGDEVYAIGNPEGLEGTFSQGVVSGIRQVGPDTLLQVTAPISPGSSGGPVLNRQGKAVGVAVATFREGQNLNFAVPARYLTALIGRAKTPVPLAGKVKLNREGGTILGDLGGRSTEGVSAGQFRWDDDGRSFTFSLRSRLPEAVTGVICLVVFYDRNRNPIDYDMVQSSDVIPPGLARRVQGHHLDFSIFGIVESLVPGDPDKGSGRHYAAEDPSSGRVEFRILDFRIVR